MENDKYLTEATYALSDKRKLTKGNLLSTVLGWQLVETFRELNQANKLDIQKLGEKDLEGKLVGIKPGFSIMSNEGGGKDFLNSELTGEQIDDKIAHHKHGTHENPEVEKLTVREHTLLHNEIRKLFEAKVETYDAIDKIYSEFRLNYDNNKLDSYAAFGDRLKAYETALIKIAIVLYHLIGDKNFITQLYQEALDKLKAEGKLPSLSNKTSAEQSSTVEEFRIYENLWT